MPCMWSVLAPCPWHRSSLGNKLSFIITANTSLMKAYTKSPKAARGSQITACVSRSLMPLTSWLFCTAKIRFEAFEKSIITRVVTIQHIALYRSVRGSLFNMCSRRHKSIVLFLKYSLHFMKCNQAHTSSFEKAASYLPVNRKFKNTRFFFLPKHAIFTC